MTPEEYEIVVRIFTRACQLPADLRNEWLAEACRDNPHLQAEVQAMLAQDAGDGFEPGGAAELADGRGMEVFQATLDAGDATARDTPPHRPKGLFAGYELLELIGRGGMGVVYRARQMQPRRIVAIKMIRAGRFASPADVRRFHAEAEAAANLGHEGIVPIYEVGEQNGEHFFSMRYIEGQSLARYIKTRTLSWREIVGLFKTLCEAIAEAHEKGIIHRDLKPSNVLIDRTGRPWVTDFGLVKHLHGDSSLTSAGDVMGTPGYMSPEQAMGAADSVTAATDVYSLGAVLYTMLTGRPPIEANQSSLLVTLRQIQEHDVAAPRALNRRIPRDLETICVKCLEQDPDGRYANAGELAAELQRYLDGEAILAKPLSAGRRLLRWARRQPGLATTWAAVTAFYIYHSMCYWILKPPNQTPEFHRASTTVAVCWVVGAWVFQRLLIRSGGRSVFLFLWTTMDVALLTFLLFDTNGAKSPIALVYHVLVAGSVLRFRARLVGYVTVLSLVGYMVHVLHTVQCRPDEHLVFTDVVPFALSLVIIGLVQYFALRRARAAMEMKS
jgi:serine/threonine-protein kinase